MSEQKKWPNGIRELEAIRNSCPGGRSISIDPDFLGKILYDIKQEHAHLIAEKDARIEFLEEEIQALTHEGRQGELEQANVGLAAENERLREALKGLLSGLVDDHGVPLDQELEDRIVSANNALEGK